MMDLTQLQDNNQIALDTFIEKVLELGRQLSQEELSYLKQIIMASPYAFEQISRDPTIFTDWLSHIQSKLSFDVSDIETLNIECLNELEIKKHLRLKRHFYLCHIIFNDICLGITVDEILSQISALANKLIEVSLDFATRIIETKEGVPYKANGDHQKLMIMAMGKLGGGELNFSSDIDLIFVYAEDGELSGSSKLSYRELFIRIGRLFTKLLNDVTEHGFVYRVDLRLRPWGDSGPLVINLAGLENYYQVQGRDWERYALVKAKVLTGQENDKKELQGIITSFVYRRYHDFNVFSGLGQLKQQIDSVAHRNNQTLNIKLGSGGIREIEFCMQALQILQGGRHQKLQVTSITKMFDLAKSETFYSESELVALRQTYEFLRVVENRIQMMFDKQTHQIPSNEEHQLRLLSSLPQTNWQDLMDDLNVGLLQVNAIFKQLFIEQQENANCIDFSVYEEEDWLKYCHELELKESELIAKRMVLFYKERAIVFMSNKGKDRLNDLLPNFMTLLVQKDNEVLIVDLLTKLFLSIAKRSVYLEMLHMHQPLLQKLIDLFEKSQWLAEEIIRFPILLESVLIANVNDQFDAQALKTLLIKELDQVSGDVELELDVLRVFKRQQLCQIAINEIDGKIKPLEASKCLSDLACIILQVSFEMNLKILIDQYGQPECVENGKIRTAKFGIIAYGKLGGDELHYTSDLDVIFVHDSVGKKQVTNGKSSIDNSVFFVRLAQKITQSISLMTSSGRVYEIDARLRPNGASGFLVTSLNAYLTYQIEKAWVWEHQALIRASFVAGDDSVEHDFKSIKCQVLENIQKRERLSQEVADMRIKMRRSFKATKDFNLKQSKGGMIDIEFIVQYLVLFHSNKLSSLCEYSANIPLLRYLHQNNCIDSDYLVLIDIYKSLHNRLHQQVLQQSSVVNIDDQMKKDIESVEILWAQCFNNE